MTSFGKKIIFVFLSFVASKHVFVAEIKVRMPTTNFIRSSKHKSGLFILQQFCLTLLTTTTGPWLLLENNANIIRKTTSVLTSPAKSIEILFFFLATNNNSSSNVLHLLVKVSLHYSKKSLVTAIFAHFQLAKKQNHHFGSQ